MTRPKNPRFEIINNHFHHAQYFPGCGASYTRFDDCVTGAGDNAAEAYQDALEQIYSNLTPDHIHWLKLPKRPIGIRVRDKVPMAYHANEMNEMYWYISIRYLRMP